MHWLIYLGTPLDLELLMTSKAGKQGKIEKGMNINQPKQDKTYNKTCVTSKDSDQPVHPPSMARILISPSLDSMEAVEGTCYQRRLIRLRRCTG